MGEGNAHISGSVRWGLDMRYTPNGKAVTEFALKTEDHDVVKITCWEKLAEAVADEVGKADEVSVIGKWYNRVYEDQYHEEKVATGITARRIMILDKGKVTKEVGKEQMHEQ